MIVHIGWQTCIDTQAILAVLDRETVMFLPKGANAQLLAQAKRTGRFTPCPEGERSYVITYEAGSLHVYASALHTITLQKRILASGERILN